MTYGKLRKLFDPPLRCADDCADTSIVYIFLRAVRGQSVGNQFPISDRLSKSIQLKSDTNFNCSA